MEAKTVSIIREKAFYKQLALISIPIALQNLIGFGVNMMDTVMLGSLGEKQISASAIANQPFFIMSIMIFGLASGASVLTAQYWGKGDMATIRKIIGIAIKASLLCSVVFSVFVIIFPESVMSIYTNDKQVILLGSQFLRIIGFSYILSGISMTFLFIIRSVEHVMFPLVISIIIFVVNTILNWLLIYGEFGFPKLGIRGSATATLISRIVEFLLVLNFAFNIDKKIKLKLIDVFSFDKQLFKDFLHYSLPVVLNETLWSVGITMQTVIIGHISSQAVAANSISSIVQRLAYVYIFGLANAAAVMVGKQIGAGNEQKARDTAFTLLIVSVFAGIIASIFMFLIRDPALMLFNISDSTKELTKQIMLVFSFVVFFAAFNSTNIVGVLRGGGDTKFALVIDVSCLWIIALPLGAIFGLIFKIPIVFVFALLFIDEPIKFLLGILRFKSGLWLRNVTRLIKIEDEIE
jgi:putative MATE family efflux protein